MPWKIKFRDDVRLAVELFGINKVASELTVRPGTVAQWVRGKLPPAEDSFIANKLAFMLSE